MTEEKTEPFSFEGLLGMLPRMARESILWRMRSEGIGVLSLYEIRMRVGRCLCLSTDRGNLLLEHLTGTEEMRETLHALCGGSVYSYADTLRQGFIPVKGGGRAGVCGDASPLSPEMTLERVRSLCIRIPHHIRGVCGEVYELFRRRRGGILVYSPPAVGKTTLLRDLAIELSRGKDPLRVALVDTRYELDNGLLPSECMIDVMRGGNKADGIAIAARTLSSEVILCDEIGAGAELSSVGEAAGCGVPLIASAHAGSLMELLAKDGFRRLSEDGTFVAAVGLSRPPGASGYDFRVHLFDGERRGDGDG